MEGVDKLRAYEDVDRFESMEPWDVAHIADEIEREIAERYMELPVDADGVPIHMGDHMRSVATDKHGVVCGVGENSFHLGDSAYGYNPEAFRHVKPRTLEDVLHDFWEEWESHPIDAEWGVRLERLRESEAKYAAEIRELLGCDAE